MALQYRLGGSSRWYQGDVNTSAALMEYRAADHNTALPEALCATRPWSRYTPEDVRAGIGVLEQGTFVEGLGEIRQRYGADKTHTFGDNVSMSNEFAWNTEKNWQRIEQRGICSLIPASS